MLQMTLHLTQSSRLACGTLLLLEFEVCQVQLQKKHFHSFYRDTPRRGFRLLEE
jgi:hypothetical protein